MAATWNVLVVDDEPDVHSLTTLTLKRKSWRGRPLALVSAWSASEAREILQASDGPKFHATLIDVVMETNDAGLQLCQFIRSSLPRTVRIILRTGQPGIAPPEKVLNDYDIDYYLAKTEVTDQRLFAVLRACFRSSLDIAVLVAVGAQLRAFTAALQGRATTRSTLISLMKESLKFLEDKYGAPFNLVPDAREPADPSAPPSTAAFTTAVAEAYKRKLPRLEVHRGTSLGLKEGTYVVLPPSIHAVTRTTPEEADRRKRWLESIMTQSSGGRTELPSEFLMLASLSPDDGAEEVRLTDRMKRWIRSIVSDRDDEPETGLVVELPEGSPEPILRELAQDLELFLTNWSVTDGLFHAQDRLDRNRIGMLTQAGWWG